MPTNHRVYVRNVFREDNGIRFNLGIYDNNLVSPGSLTPEDSATLRIPFGQTGSFVAEKIAETLRKWEEETLDFQRKSLFINRVFSGLSVIGSVGFGGSLIIFP